MADAEYTARVAKYLEKQENRRYHVIALIGDVTWPLPAAHRDDEAQAVTIAIAFEALGIFGRVIVWDTLTVQVVAAFQDGKPLDPSKLDV